LARYQALGLSYWYSGLHLLPVALDAILIIQLTLAMRDRRQRCERLERED
jgi:hypothetical protein